MTTDQIISATTCHDPERFRYEVESKCEFEKRYGGAFYPEGQTQIELGYDNARYYSSQGKHIATFKLKAWK